MPCHNVSCLGNADFHEKKFFTGAVQFTKILFHENLALCGMVVVCISSCEYITVCSMNPYNIKGTARATNSMYGTVG